MCNPIRRSGVAISFCNSSTIAAARPMSGSSAGHAGVSASVKLTFEPDHSMKADQCWLQRNSPTPVLERPECGLDRRRDLVPNMAAIARLSIAETLSSVGSTPAGLTSQEAERRFGEYGPNRVEQVRRRPLPLRLLQEFVQFFSIILLDRRRACVSRRVEQPGRGHGSHRLCHHHRDSDQRLLF